jgi:hypothetical protein
MMKNEKFYLAGKKMTKWLYDKILKYFIVK